MCGELGVNGFLWGESSDEGGIMTEGESLHDGIIIRHGQTSDTRVEGLIGYTGISSDEGESHTTLHPS